MHRSALILALLAAAGAAHAQTSGPSTAQVPYMLPSDAASGVRFISIASNGNGNGGLNAESYNLLDENNNVVPGGAYQLLGIPDGMGAYDNGDGTFTLVVSHELGATASTVHSHGNRGAAISRWIVRGGSNVNPGAIGNNFQVIGARDQNLNYNLYNISSNQYQNFNASNPMPQYAPGSANGIQGWNFNNPNRDGTGRYCSGDLAPVSAYQWTSPTGQTFGTSDRIYLNGEEIGSNGRAFAHLLNGAEANSAWELPRLGHFSWENSVANPLSQRQTVVVGTDDSGTGGLYVYVGTKTDSGNAIERAGLTNGNLYGLAVLGMGSTNGQPVETRAGGLNTNGVVYTTSARFGLHNFGDVTNIPGSTITSNGVTTQGLQQIGDANGVSNFLRPEDAHWNPANPRELFFLTTDGSNASGGRSRLYRALFDDIANPTAGGQIDILLDSGLANGGAASLFSGTGASTFEMADNMTVTVGLDGVARVLIQEDVGNQDRLGRMWLFDTSNNSLLEIGVSNATYFQPGSANFLTRDEEASGIIEADWLGKGWFLLNMQAHYAIPGELVEGGQLMAVYIPQTIPAPGAAALLGLGGAVAFRRRRR